MNCLVCRNGLTQPGRATVTLERGKSTIIFRSVPADVCDNCGEYYLGEAVSADLYRRAEEAVRRGAEIEILQYVA